MLVALGGTVVLLFTPYLISKGRRRNILLFSLTMTLASLVSGSGFELGLYIGRFMTGFSGGLFGSTFPVYLYEMSP